MKEKQASSVQLTVQIGFAFFLVMTLDFGAIKLSVLLLYRRIFIGPYFKIYSAIMIALVALWCTSFFFATAFQCGTNIAYWWTSTATIHEYCVDTARAELALAISDIITDIMILAIPLPMIWKLHLTPGQKVGLYFIFLLGLLSVSSFFFFSF